MSAAAPTHTTAPRGASRLLAHCGRFAGTPDDRPSARDRVESELGTEFARFLIDALASGPRRAFV